MALSFWLAWKVTTRRALMGISSPVLGLRPGRCGLSRSWKLPKPESLTLSPRSSAPRISSKNASTMSLASRLFSPTFSKSRSASSAFVKVITGSPDSLLCSDSCVKFAAQQGDQRIAGSVCLRIRKGSFSMLHNYPERKAFPVRGDALATEQAEQAYGPHNGGFFGLQGVQNRLDRGLQGEKHRDVAQHNRQVGRDRQNRQRDRLHRFGIQLKQDRRLWQLVLLQPLRVQLAEPADRRAGDHDARRAAGVKGRVRAGLEARRKRREHRLQIRLHVEQVYRASRPVPLLAERGT